MAVCPNRVYITSPGAQVSRLRRIESLLLAVVCPMGRSNRKREKIEVVRTGKARRAKLFYLRDRVGKAAKVKELVK